jgi:hypothetical protein
VIRKSTFGNSGKAALTREEFDSIRAAKSAVLLALVIEERFAMFRENHQEYEREIFEIAQKHVMYARSAWYEKIDDIYPATHALIRTAGWTTRIGGGTG